MSPRRFVLTRHLTLPEMFIQFAATGNPALDVVDTNVLHPEFLKKGTAPTQPVLSTQFGGKVTSGSFRFFNRVGKPQIVWKTASGTTMKTWVLTNDAAVDTAKTTIAAATATFVLLPSGAAA